MIQLPCTLVTPAHTSASNKHSSDLTGTTKQLKKEMSYVLGKSRTTASGRQGNDFESDHSEYSNEAMPCEALTGFRPDLSQESVLKEDQMHELRVTRIASSGAASLEVGSA